MTPAEERRIQSRLQALEEQVAELSSGLLELQKWEADMLYSKKHDHAAPALKAKTKGKATQ